MAEYEISFSERMSAIDRAEWDSLASRYRTPLLTWGFLALLEESRSICPETGWKPAHLLLRQSGPSPAGGKLVACAPFYVKSHSWGEFVFDFQFAGIAERAKADWYPKLVGMVPATPAPAWRIMVAEGEDESGLSAVALDAAVAAAKDAGLGGVHILWPDAGFETALRHPQAGKPEKWVEWSHQAFLWSDEGFGNFEGYLASFSKNMRRNVRRERDSVREAGIATRMLRPENLVSRPDILATMADFYESHNDKFGPWAAKFLTRDFFLRLGEFMPSGWTLAAAFERAPESAPEAYREVDGIDGEAEDVGDVAGVDGGAGPGGVPDGKPIALAFLLEGLDRLYGRYWGASRDVNGLHFELCYYLPIEYALDRGIASFDPGMGSPHKARRGFRSHLAPSFHRVFDRRLASLMARVMPELNAEENATVVALNGELPFKQRSGQ